MASAPTTDFYVIDHGNIVSLVPSSPPAKDWVQEYLPEDALWHGRGVVIEHRYWPDIYAGILDAGLSVS